MRKKTIFVLLILLLINISNGWSQAKKEGEITKRQTNPTFVLGKKDFLLNGQPFQMRAGEIHPNRIPKDDRLLYFLELFRDRRREI
jgi:hypothetical protein